jgi:hypothetical protein
VHGSKNGSRTNDIFPKWKLKFYAATGRDHVTLNALTRPSYTFFLLLLSMSCLSRVCRGSRQGQIRGGGATTMAESGDVWAVVCGSGVGGHVRMSSETEEEDVRSGTKLVQGERCRGRTRLTRDGSCVRTAQMKMQWAQILKGDYLLEDDLRKWKNIFRLLSYSHWIWMI